MIKLVMCITKHPDLTTEQFKDYWLNQHGPHFMQIAEDYRAKKYVQSCTIDSPLNSIVQKVRGITQQYDGIAEI